MIPDDITLNYANEHGYESYIRNGRIAGYFEGKINGMGGEEITDA